MDVEAPVVCPSACQNTGAFAGPTTIPLFKVFCALLQAKTWPTRHLTPLHHMDTHPIHHRHASFIYLFLALKFTQKLHKKLLGQELLTKDYLHKGHLRWAKVKNKTRKEIKDRYTDTDK
jgi:hypothetical protein